MRKLIGLIIAAGMICAILPASLIGAAGEGSISGQVVNKTQGGSAPGTLELTLTTFVNNNATITQITTTDNTNRFSFTGLTIDATYTYQVSAIFQEVSYKSAKITLTSANPAQTIALDVYDTTTSDAAIQLSSGHIVIYVDSGALQVLEVWDFNNAGDKTYIGTKGTTARQTLRFTLPTSATSLTPGQDFIPETTDTGIVDTAPVLPGTAAPRTDSFSYVIPYQGSTATINRTLDYPVANFAVLVQDVGEIVKSTSLIQSTPQNMGGIQFQYFTAGNLSKGFNIDVSLSGLGKSTGTSPSTTKTSGGITWIWLAAGILAVVLIAIIVYPQLKKRLAQAESGVETEEPVKTNDSEEDKLVADLAHLDNEYHAGKITKQDYLNRRSELKSQLMKVWKDEDQVVQ